MTQGQDVHRPDTPTTSHSQERRSIGFLSRAQKRFRRAVSSPRGYLPGGLFKRAPLILCGPRAKVHEADRLLAAGPLILPGPNYSIQRLPNQQFQVFSLSFLSACHLSLTLLVRYRCTVNI